MASASIPTPHAPPRMEDVDLVATPTLLTLGNKNLHRILRYTFAGALLIFKTNSFTRSQRWHVRGHQEILFTCRLCYREGYDIFFQEAAVYGLDDWWAKVESEVQLGVPRIQAAAGLGYYSPYRLRHVRNIHIPWSRRDPVIPAGQLPRLRTCEIMGMPLLVNGSPDEIRDVAEWRPIVVRDPGLDIDDDESWINFVRRISFHGLKPVLYLYQNNVIIPRQGVQYLMLITIVLGREHPVAPGTVKVSGGRGFLFSFSFSFFPFPPPRPRLSYR